MNDVECQGRTRNKISWKSDGQVNAEGVPPQVGTTGAWEIREPLTS